MEEAIKKYGMIHFSFTFIKDEGKYFCNFSNLEGNNNFKQLSKKKYDETIKTLNEIL